MRNPSSKKVHPPLLSIISATYNREKYVKDMLDSVAKQQTINFEHIIIDGQSTDKTVDIVKKYIDENKSRYKITFLTAPPKGVYNALNIGIKLAKGKYIVNLHSDDYFVNNKSTDKIQNCLEKNNYPSWIVGDHSIEIFKIRNIRIKTNKLFLLAMKKYMVLSHPNTIISKVVFYKFGYYKEELLISADYFYLLNLLKNNIHPVFAKTSFITFRMHDSNLSLSKKYRNQRRIENLLRKQS